MTTDNEIFVDQVTAALEIKSVGENPFITISNDMRVEDLERMLPAPLAHRGYASFQRIESFTEYVKAFKAEQSRFYVEKCEHNLLPDLSVIIDHPTKEAPAWRRFRALFSAKPSRQLKEWTGSNKRQLKPAQLAQFIMRNRADVIDPDASTLAEILRDIRGTANVQFSEAVDEFTGAKAALYAEKVTLKGGKGDVTIPTGFRIGVPIYERQKNRVALDCFLRAEVIEGRVMFTYEIDQLEDKIDLVIDKLVEEVEDEIEMKALYGAPA